MPKFEKTCTIVNSRGLHARAAAKFVKTASAFQSEITIKKGARQANGKSIMGILTLAAPKGTQVLVSADGSDAEQALSALVALINQGFDEEET